MELILQYNTNPFKLKILRKNVNFKELFNLCLHQQKLEIHNNVKYVEDLDDAGLLYFNVT